ncbi:MAG: indolepyruvate ferredoxin oxidoreductase subunit alpha [Candidatus Thorarchaeota archaeon]|nr:indolepyruvate ferredoxin oxidoreductase subunit alpha [Candidatus Thorarchaeota archaeon]
MSGNEALARGALEAGIGFCASYPGTPSTEIATTLMKESSEHDIYVEWSVNEKVALEACAGASWLGIPALCSMKSLGLNVASDFLLNVNLSGTGSGGLVIIVCDDPQGHSSSNEQDSRFYAKEAEIPLLEPSTCQNAKDVVPYAFRLSQEHQIPVMIRSTTRLSHSRALVKPGKIPERDWKVSQILPDNLYNIPYPYHKHGELDEKTGNASADFEMSGFNNITKGTNADMLVIASGVSYLYALEAVRLLDITNVDVANLVTTYPLPLSHILQWIENKKKILFVEEVAPFVEEQVLALVAELQHDPRDFYGKRNGAMPWIGELNTDIVKKAIKNTSEGRIYNTDREIPKIIDTGESLLITRPLTFCAGCTHRNIYWAIRKLRNRLKGKLAVAGDIGCYSLGIFYDNAMETMQAMGSGIGTASGMGQLKRFGFDTKVIAVAGDSTFFHSCIPGLINARNNNADLTFVIMDNATSAMTGFQEHPGSKKQSFDKHRVSIEGIVESIGPDHFLKGDATDIPSTLDILWDAVNREGLKVVLLEGVCKLEEQQRGVDYANLKRIVHFSENCKGEKCKICAGQFSCTALGWNNETGQPYIIEHLCTRCGTCVDVCPNDALREEE